jgi:hypothetical protein
LVEEAEDLLLANLLKCLNERCGRFGIIHNQSQN